jgi:hypothetical protein
VVQPGSLRREMTGNLIIKPVLDLGSQMKDFDGHGGIPVYLGTRPTRIPAPPT